MKTRGFTTIELLVSLAIMLVVGALVTGGVRPQAHNAGSQVRVAAMQQGARSAFDLLARDLRMTGYGVELTMPGVPPPVSVDQDNLLVLNANFTNVKTVGSGAGSTVTVTDTAGFATGNYLVIKSSWRGEAKKITAVGSTTIQIAQPLARTYPPGSEVSQIEAVRYQLAGATVLRNGQPMVDGVQALDFQYFLADGTLVDDPSGVEDDIRNALVSMQTHTLDQPAAATAEDMSIQAEVRIRNLGLLRVARRS